MNTFPSNTFNRHDGPVANLHELYVERVNSAVEADRFDLVEELTAEYDVEVAKLVAA